jgi:hypothetical protein
MFAIALTLMLGADASNDVVLPSQPLQNPQRSGAAVAPAALPAGSLAFAGFIGAPEVGAAYRQGFSLLELEAQARFHYLEVSAVVEAGVRFAAWKNDRVVMAPTAALGLKLNTGARVFDGFNFGFSALRPRLGLITSVLATDILNVIVALDVPWAVALNVTGYQVTPTIGGGVEFQLSSKLSLVGMGQLGVDVIKEPLGIAVARPAWGVRLGVGYRVF